MLPPRKKTVACNKTNSVFGALHFCDQPKRALSLASTEGCDCLVMHFSPSCYSRHDAQTDAVACMNACAWPAQSKAVHVAFDFTPLPEPLFCCSHTHFSGASFFCFVDMRACLILQLLLCCCFYGSKLCQQLLLFRVHNM